MAAEAAAATAVEEVLNDFFFLPVRPPSKVASDSLRIQLELGEKLFRRILWKLDPSSNAAISFSTRAISPLWVPGAIRRSADTREEILGAAQ